MKELQISPIPGACRSQACVKTIQNFSRKLSKASALRGGKVLDIGCGDGSLTLEICRNFQEVWAIDVNDKYIESCREKVTGNAKYHIYNMSAERIEFPDNYFDAVITIESIEHIPQLEAAATEIWRVLKGGGELLLTCPNALFPSENHGIRLFGRTIEGRIPLVTYLPFLHRRIALARVFRVRELDALFGERGFRRVYLDYLMPTFEHGGNPFQKILRPLFPLMLFLEETPLKMFGTSIVAKYIKKP